MHIPCFLDQKISIKKSFPLTFMGCQDKITQKWCFPSLSWIEFCSEWQPWWCWCLDSAPDAAPVGGHRPQEGVRLHGVRRVWGRPGRHRDTHGLWQGPGGQAVHAGSISWSVRLDPLALLLIALSCLLLVAPSSYRVTFLTGAPLNFVQDPMLTGLVWKCQRL